jgi:hypothetical protein
MQVAGLVGLEALGRRRLLGLPLGAQFADQRHLMALEHPR